MIRVLVAGLGNMGRSHALAYHADPAFEVVGLVNRSAVDLPEALQAYPLFADYAEALAALRPDLVCVATYSDSHADYAVAAMEAGADVFVEKPLATRWPMPSAWWHVPRGWGASWWWAISCAIIPAGSA